MSYTQKLREEHKARRACLGLVKGVAIVPLSRARQPQEAPSPVAAAGKPLSSEELLRAAAERYARRSIPDRVRLTDIEDAVKLVFQVTSRELCSKHRGGKIVVARSAAMWIARRLMDISYSQLGRHFNRDHTSVIHCVERFPERMERDPALADAVQSIIDALGGDE